MTDRHPLAARVDEALERRSCPWEALPNDAEPVTRVRHAMAAPLLEHPGCAAPEGRVTPRHDQLAHTEEVCVTCSETAVVVRVLHLLGDELALVDTGTGHEEVSVALVDPACLRPGAALFVHAKEAIGVPR